MTKRIRDIGFAATAALTLLLGTEAGAALILDETLTTTFGSGVTTVNPSANDLSNAPSTLHLGQLAATRSGIVDFFYIGHEAGYTNVVGIDSDPEKVAHGVRRSLDCRAARAFEFIETSTEPYDVIIAEQELNHLTLDEQVEFLALCRKSLRPGGFVFVYGLNGANPLVGSENLSHNIDHFNTFTEHSLGQVLKLAGFENVRTMPLAIYVFWKNPLNYVGLAFTAAMEAFFKVAYKMYGKNVKILTKKIAAIAS